jgi:hypothetical protein
MCLALIMMIGASPAAAEQAWPQEAPAKPAKICRENERQTGSHIRTGRICKTAEQWQAEDEARGRVPPSLTVTEGQQDGNPAQPPR